MTDKGMVSEQAVMAALGQVQEPELHKDLVTLNMIRDLKIEGGKVAFTVVLTTPACPLREQIDLDSMDFLNLVSALHKRFGLPIPEADYPRLATTALAVAYLKQALAA